MNFFRLPLLAVLALSTLGMARKSTVSIRWHLEVGGQEGAPFALPVKFVNPPREGFMSSIPAVSERNITGIYPVQAANGSWGCAFRLDQEGRISLETLSQEHRGASMVAFVSTKGGTHQVMDMIVDQPVSDGILYIPQGLTALEIETFKKKYPLFGPKAAVAPKKSR